MPYVNDTLPTAGTNTNDAHVSARIKWSEAHRTWANSHYTWASSGANFTNDSKPSGTYTNDSLT